MKHFFCSCGLWLLILLSGTTQAAEKKLTVGVYDFYPICHSHEHFNPSNTNFFPDLLDYIAEKEGWTLKYIPGTLADHLKRLKNNTIDLLVAVPYNINEAPVFKYTGENVISTWAQIYSHKDIQIDTIPDLSSHSIGVLRDDPYNEKIRQMIDRFDLKCRILEFKHYEDLMYGLENRWIDSGVVERLTGSLYEKRFPIVKTPIVFSPIELRFAAASHIDTSVLPTIDYYLRELKNDPDSVYHQLLKTIMIQPENNRLPRWLAWALAAGIFLTAIAFLSSLFLKRQVAKKTNEISEKNNQLKEEIKCRETAECALKQSNLLNEKTLANMKDGLLLLDPSANKILKANHAAAEIFGFADKTMPHVLPDRLHANPEQASQFYDTIRHSVAKQGFFSGQWPLQRKNKDIFPAEITVTPISLNGNPNNYSWVVTIRDITEKIKAEEALEQSRIQLDQAKKMESIGRLAGGVAHDFNNLLMGIQGRTSLMMLNADPSSQDAVYLTEIEECVSTASQLVGQLLGFARGGKYEVKPTDINEILSATADMFGRTRKEITIHKEFCENPWPVEVDQGQIKQVFLNMLVNAWQAMPNGGNLCLTTENITITSRTPATRNLEPGRYIRIAIEDTGIGMDKETQERIFEPFFTTKERGRGTGLGLASVYGILQSHHGAISVTSEKNIGTIFHIHLPATDKTVNEQQIPDESLHQGKGTILLVDDEKMVSNVGEKMLCRIGYEVFVANNGQQAIDTYSDKKNSIDLVILDIIMPGMCGKEVYACLKEINPGIKVLLSSGYSLDDQAAEIMEQGCNGFIQKPYSLKALSGKLNEVLA